MLGKTWVLICVMTIAVLCFMPATYGRNLDIPDYVTMGSLSSLFEEVEFDHEMHIDTVDDCSTCHHHTTGTPTSDEACAKCHSGDEVSDVISCGGCHVHEPFSAEHLAGIRQDRSRYHIQLPGLKAVYHLNCLQCHVEMDAPAGCEDCHARNKTGDRFYHSGDFAPKAVKTSHGH